MDSGDLDWLLQVAETGSLSGAAKAGGVAVSTVARRLDLLEARLNLRLLDRRRDGARLTPDGVRIAACAGEVVDSVDRLERIAAALRTGSQAPVVISATEFVVSDILAPALPALAAAHPTLKVELRSQASVVSLAGRQADLAIRMSRPEGASLVAKKLIELKLGLFASEAYLDGRDPARLDLKAERLIIYDESYGRLPELDWVALMGLDDAVAYRTNSTRALLVAAAGGGGIATLPAIFAERAGMIEVDTPFSLPRRTPWLVTHSDLKQRPDLKLAKQWIVGVFRALQR
ncbi:LysR substrate-binding domain-containing protein (plasmid) [Caulobacter sp. ErkDOM-YI]|uniref:LysR substrate-binding domain-containing protein n=1 Tax=unclassified Caulobacter TaxID=2648921 RepID=UPI003AF62792